MSAGRRLARRVLLVGWDAADWRVIHPLLDAGEMPNLPRSWPRGRAATWRAPPASPDALDVDRHGQPAQSTASYGFIEPLPDGRPLARRARRAAQGDLEHPSPGRAEAPRRGLVAVLPGRAGPGRDGLEPLSAAARGPRPRVARPDGVHPPRVARSAGGAARSTRGAARPSNPPVRPRVRASIQDKDKRLAHRSTRSSPSASRTPPPPRLLEHAAVGLRWRLLRRHRPLRPRLHGLPPAAACQVSEADFAIYQDVVAAPTASTT